MCSMEKGSIVSCQIAYFPIDSEKYLDEIKEMLNLIKSSGLDYAIGTMSTVIKGEADKVFNLIRNIHEQMSFKNYSYTMNIMLSNICGCKR